MGNLRGESSEQNRKEKVTRFPSVTYAGQLGFLVNTLGSTLKIANNKLSSIRYRCPDIFSEGSPSGSFLFAFQVALTGASTVPLPCVWPVRLLSANDVQARIICFDWNYIFYNVAHF